MKNTLKGIWGYFTYLLTGSSLLLLTAQIRDTLKMLWGCIIYLLTGSRLLVTDEIHELIDQGVIANCDHSAVKGTSLDVRLHHILMLEKKPNTGTPVIIPRETKMSFTLKDLSLSALDMRPKQFLLGALVEWIKLPPTITAKFYLDSSLARCGLEHSAAISMKPGWEGRLTLELTNDSQYHAIKLSNGMPIGCIEFTKHKRAAAYEGRYQNQRNVDG